MANAVNECLGFRRQTTALIVGEPQTSGADLFPQGAVLLLDIVDDIALLLVHPTGERDENEPQRRRQRGMVSWLQEARVIGSLAPDLESSSLPNRHSVLASIGFSDIRPRDQPAHHGDHVGATIRADGGSGLT